MDRCELQKLIEGGGGGAVERPAARPLPFDIERILCDINSGFNPLHDNPLIRFRVMGAKGDFVFLTLAVPKGMLRVFTSLLDNLGAFFRFMDNKTRGVLIQEKLADLAEIEKARKVQTDFSEKVCSFYDGFIAHGFPRKEAVKRTNWALKDEKHPWANRDSVLDVLRAAGRFKKGSGVYVKK
ncbi:MAG: hypothetical protein JXB25_02180 [Deltaproteobacteria bacterium]|nr:hypothetical protein [Deltaproteobacteria bacterium]